MIVISTVTLLSTKRSVRQQKQMEFPFGHHHHHHQRNDQENEPPPPPFDQQPPPYYQENEFAPPSPRPPPPPYYQETEFSPPPPRPPPPYYQETEFPPPQSTHVTHLHHTSHQQEFNSQPSPPAAQVSHVAHEQTEASHHSFKPHLPSFLHSHSASVSHPSSKPTVRVYCKADPNFSLAIRDGKVILATSDQTDEFQHWFKDEKYSTRVKDEEGFPCFALVNKATGQALKHSVGATHPVQLIPYNADVLDESILWSESKDLGDGYRAVRMINNIRLNVDAFHGDKKSGGVRDGTTIVLWQWNKGDNQRWKMNLYR